MSQSPTNRAVVRAADSVATMPIAAGSAAESQVLVGPADGAPNFAMRRFTMGENGGMPLHTNDVEHEQYVLRGRAEIRIGDEVHVVGPADVLFIPARLPHSYRVLEGPFEFLCMVPNQPDQVRLIDEATP